MRRFFTSRHIFKVDKKGRVSVPANFRAVIEDEGGANFVYLRKVPREPVLEGITPALLQELAASIQTLPHNSPERKRAQRAVFAKLQEVRFDPDGRMVLPADLRAYAGIDESAAFVGLGASFQIWDPDTLDRVETEELEEDEDVVLEAMPRDEGAA